jgi:hypothetical protein
VSPIGKSRDDAQIYLCLGIKNRNVSKREDTNICFFETLFLAEVRDAPEKLKLELNELQYDFTLNSSFSQKVLIAFYASLPTSRFSE